MTTDAMYKQAILDHYRHPRNFGEMKDAEVTARDSNPLCGDDCTYFMKFDREKRMIKELKFHGRGCAISMAAASMMSEKIPVTSIDELKQLTEDGVIKSLGVDVSPMRRNCATLGLRVMLQGIEMWESGRSLPTAPEAAATRPSIPIEPNKQVVIPQLLVGQTPLIRLNSENWGIGKVKILAKAEWMNVGGTLKARPAQQLIREATVRRFGPLLPGMTILDGCDASSGIAIAAFGAQLGFPVKLILPYGTSTEFQAILAAYGAQVQVLQDPKDDVDAARRVARETFKRAVDSFCFLEIYEHPATWKAHYETTGHEIVQQAGTDATHFVCGVGTGGTITGTGKRLKENIPGIQVVAVQPNSPEHGIQGLKYMAEGEKPKTYDETVQDRTILIDTAEAEEYTRLLAKKEGLLCGTSSGAALAACVKIAKEIQEGTIITIFGDSGERYLNSNHWLVG